VDVPNCLLASFETYHACKTYADVGLIRRRVVSEFLVRQSNRFSTEFDRGRLLRFSGKASGAAQPIEANTAVPICNWQMTYDWITASISKGTSSVDATVAHSYEHISDMFREARAVSFGASALIPSLLLSDSLQTAWFDSSYSFDVVEENPQNSIVRATNGVKHYEIQIVTGTGLIRLIKIIESVEDREHLDVLQEMLSNASADQAKHIKPALEILSGVTQSVYEVETIFDYKEVEVSLQ
jgi:hypothetical protein